MAVETWMHPVTISGEPVEAQSVGANSCNLAMGRIELELGGGRMMMSGNVAPELAQAVVAALRGKR